ncbi:formate/nitrite transporter family protein [Acetoanaerobium noterae]|uniref:formate/nitrite transporter family protein n=1 Tax=Acetoanaerobium noterae TaxID=745369 RepID=UPI003221476F
MFTETKNLLSEVAVKKVNFYKSGIIKYLIASMWAGTYVGFGIFLIMTIGGLGSESNFPFTKMLMGLSFGIALSLVIMAGSELFTGNNMILTVGALDKKVTWKDSANIWVWSFIGNAIGSTLLGLLLSLTNASATPTGAFILKTAATKMNGDFIPLLVNGILCNLLVCLAVLCSVKMKSESGKLIMVFWCLFAFITSGFEHSVANMTIFATALFMPHPETVSLMGVFQNMIPVTLGNFIGGALLLGASYFYMGKES